METRVGRVARKTRETEIQLMLNLDGGGSAEVDTGIGFFDHMLECFAKHGFFDMKLKAVGDVYVDSHHTVEDTGIVLGEGIRQALGDKKGIARYGNATVPMDETLVMCAIDLSGRPYLNFDAKFTVEKVGYLDTEMVEEFFRALSYTARMNLHLVVLKGQNNHHIIEAMFKAFAKALDMAVAYDARIKDTLSTKGTLE